MNRVAAFFEKIGHYVKVEAVDVGHEFKTVFVALFGAQALTELETVAETMLTSDFGQAVLADATQMLQNVQAGQIGQGTAIVQLAQDIVQQAIKTGRKMESTLVIMIASMAIAKAQGLISTPAPAPANPPPKTPPAPDTPAATP